VAGDPQRFRRLLTEQVRVRDLVRAVAHEIRRRSMVEARLTGDSTHRRGEARLLPLKARLRTQLARSCIGEQH